MALKLQSTVLITSDLALMRKFYEDVLEQAVEFDFGNNIGYKSGLSLWELKQNYPISKALGYLYNKNGNHNLEICFETDEFEESISKIKQYNVDILHDTVVETWGQKTIRIFDPEKNIIEIGETMKCFVSRYYNEGYSVEDISKLTSVPIEVINRLVS